jgi:nicotinic acid mononucleotide adenylyltransferase
VLVAIQFQHRASKRHPARAAIFPGAWNPPTVAHRAIARAALQWAEEVIWVLPRAFPHKAYEGAGFDERLHMLGLLMEPGFSVAISEGGLYVEIADEAREFFGRRTEIGMVCGRDAAERIAGWDYGRPGVFAEMLEKYPLLVAGRAGEYHPPEGHADRIITLTPDECFDEISSTDVRRRIASGEPWRGLVAEPIADIVAVLYGAKPPL